MILGSAFVHLRAFLSGKRGKPEIGFTYTLYDEIFAEY